MNYPPNPNGPSGMPGHGHDGARNSPAPDPVHYGSGNFPPSHGNYNGHGSYGSHGGQHPGYGPGADWPPGMATRPYQSNSSWLNLSNDRFIKGALIGAAAAYLLTNESVQRTLIKSAVRAWTLVQSGVEEVKERFHDAEAEVQAEANKDA
ncbi:hypothetical protein Thiowin_03838 [Thiorhodovibrio winogradskyi]|uniref:YtxH domain-containing protein n=1 Tax=Thiorhodovibrio winogradskyi TaxID=77007 RepID=A0ABZ0SEP1_9GAMM|nr:YtxH domain-containing protein [Thiorhodovibrio winogradskyi]